MLTLLLLAIALVFIVGLAVILVGAGGAAILLVFGDLIVAIAVIVLIVKFIRRKK